MRKFVVLAIITVVATLLIGPAIALAAPCDGIPWSSGTGTYNGIPWSSGTGTYNGIPWSSGTGTYNGIPWSGGVCK